MAISCTECGRQYDVTLFEFGRTISCACGARVGLEHRLDLPGVAEIRFFADVNVARLVRWLRALGLDTAWEDAIADAEIVRRAILERRFVLTLDKRLPREFLADNILLLRNDDPAAQLREIVTHFGIEKPAELFTRCLVCNTPLRDARPAEIAACAVPDAARRSAVIRFCPHCRKAYWEGSHTRRMRAAFENVFGS
jgi:uncharacterized protein with PIN domain